MLNTKGCFLMELRQNHKSAPFGKSLDLGKTYIFAGRLRTINGYHPGYYSSLFSTPVLNGISVGPAGLHHAMHRDTANAYLVTARCFLPGPGYKNG